MSVSTVCNTSDIAKLYRHHFKVDSLTRRGTGDQLVNAESIVYNGPLVKVTVKEISNVIRKNTRGKSPSHDGLTIEHLQHAGVHLPRVLSMLFTYCIRHKYVSRPYEDGDRTDVIGRVMLQMGVTISQYIWLP